MITELMRKLKGAKTAKHWEAAISELEASIQATTANVGLLRGARKSALFEQQNEEEVAILQQRIRQNEDELEMLKDNLELARARHEEALRQEDRAEVDRLIGDAQADLRKQSELCAGYIATLDKMAKSFVELEGVQRRLGDVNAELVRRGYPEDQLRFVPAWPGNVEAQINHMAQTLGGVANFNALRYLRDALELRRGGEA